MLILLSDQESAADQDQGKSLLQGKATQVKSRLNPLLKYPPFITLLLLEGPAHNQGGSPTPIRISSTVFLGEVPTEVILIFDKLTIKPTIIDGDQTPDKNQGLEGKVCFDLYFREKNGINCLSYFISSSCSPFLF